MVENKYVVIAIFGPSAAGKDTIAKWLVEHMENTNEIISCTTRPPRDYEINKKDYYFLSEEEFKRKIKNNEMLESTRFRDWLYGTSINALKKDKINIGVFNIDGIKYLTTDNRLKVYPVYIYASDKIRLLRSLFREENPDCAEICRRFLADKEDFKDIDNSIFNFITYINETQNSEKFIDLQLMIEQDINK